MDARDRARGTFRRHLVESRYPGRGLVVGRREDDRGWWIVYFIMGRSENSRNRVFRADGERLWTQARDPSLVKDPSLILYDAMLAVDGVQIVSNGDQTRTVHDGLQRGGDLLSALATREREPDAPNYTPRITAVVHAGRVADRLELAILKANPADPSRTDRFHYRPADPPPGLGYGLTTYRGDGSPLPSFEGDPLLLPLEGDGGALLDRYWEALDADNRVALAVKSVADDGRAEHLDIRNR